MELAFAQVDTVLWPAFGPWFAAVEIHGDQADRLRALHQRYTDAEAESEESEAVLAARGALLDSFREMRDDPACFWKVVYYLQFDPQTGHSSRHLTDSLFDLPAIDLLPEGSAEALTAAAERFLELEDDHGDEWLGTNKKDNRAWAGYLALALLDVRGQLASVDESILARWSAAILWFHSVPIDTGQPDRKKALLTRCTRAHPEVMSRRLVQYVRGELRRGSSIWEIEAFDVESVLRLRTTWISLIQEVTAAMLAEPGEPLQSDDPSGALDRFPTADRILAVYHDWLLLFQGLSSAACDEASALVERLLSDDRPVADELAARGVSELIGQYPELWPSLRPKVRTRESIQRKVALRLAGTTGFVAAQTEAELAEIYTWLSTLMPPDDDPPLQMGVSYSSPESEARRWRDNLLAVLADRANSPAIQHLATLHRIHPGRTTIRYQLLRARSASFAKGWNPPTPGELQRLFEDGRRRLVRSAEELGALVVQTLNEIADGLGHTGQLLWDRRPTPRSAPELWRPKPEAALSAFVANELQQRLHDRGVAAHREVVVKQTDAYGSGDRVDIHVEVRSRPRVGTPASQYRVIIEVKGCWNDLLMSAQIDQLAGRYLPEAATNVGVYLVGWYPKDLWDPSDPRRSRGPSTAEEILDELTAQAIDALETGAVVTPVVLTIPRPARVGAVSERSTQGDDHVDSAPGSHSKASDS